MRDDNRFYIIKSKLDTFIKYPKITDLIRERVVITNKIWTETCFLFNLHIMRKLNKKQNIKFNDITIERCALYVLGLSDNIRKKNMEYKSIGSTYRILYRKSGNNCVTQYRNLKSIKKPIEYLSKQLMVNILNHVSLNFDRFQKRYLKSKVFDEFSKLNVDRSTMYSLLGCIKYHINKNVKTITIKSKKLVSHPEIKTFLPIMKTIINEERKYVPNSILYKTTDFNLRKNYGDVIKYYYHMVSYLEEHERKRFSILPQISLGNSYVRFDSRLLSVFYDEWVKTIEKPKEIPFDCKKVGIKAFEKDCQTYYKRILNLDKFKTKNIMTSFLTNGYSVCVLLKSDKKEQIEANNVNLDDFFGDKKFKRGLFDADNSRASEEFLNKFHKISIDPNNKVMLYCYSESGNKLEITKNYFNDISHIKRNNIKMRNRIKESNIKKAYSEFLDTGYKKTIKIANYVLYIKIYRKYWDTIWNFYNLRKVQKLELDTYINRKKAIHKVARKLVPKNKSVKFQRLKSDFIQESSLDNVKHKPTLISFGKGNGSTTISNLRNSSPKGPIKAVAKELSKLCPVILTDEYNTSQVCSKCGTKSLENPVMERRKVKRIKEDNVRKKVVVRINQSCHSLCHCNNEAHTGMHRVWNRDYNAARNIMNVMTRKLLGHDLGIFSRKKIRAKTIRFSLREAED